MLSESTRSKDLVQKPGLYMESGVREYWVVNTASEEILIYLFENHSIDKILTFKGKEQANSAAFPGLKVALEDVFS